MGSSWARPAGGAHRPVGAWSERYFTPPPRRTKSIWDRPLLPRCGRRDAALGLHWTAGRRRTRPCHVGRPRGAHHRAERAPRHAVPRNVPGRVERWQRRVLAAEEQRQAEDVEGGAAELLEFPRRPQPRTEQSCFQGSTVRRCSSLVRVFRRARICGGDPMARSRTAGASGWVDDLGDCIGLSQRQYWVRQPNLGAARWTARRRWSRRHRRLGYGPRRVRLGGLPNSLDRRRRSKESAGRTS